jgi:hypothetical protein
MKKIMIKLPLLLVLLIAAASLESCSKAPHMYDNGCYMGYCDGNHEDPYYYQDPISQGGQGGQGGQLGPCEIVCVGGSATAWLTSRPSSHTNIMLETSGGIQFKGSCNGNMRLFNDLKNAWDNPNVDNGNISVSITATGVDSNPYFLVVG